MVLMVTGKLATLWLCFACAEHLLGVPSKRF
jgi:hypothetical protein